MTRKPRKTLQDKVAAGTKRTGNSRYARKTAYLRTNPVRIAAGVDTFGKAKFHTVHLFGFQVPEPKPWKR